MSKHTERVSKMTEEQKTEYNEKKKVAAQAYKERQKVAKSTIKDFLTTDEGKELPEEVRKAMEYLTGSGQRTARAGVTNLLRDRLLEMGTMSGIEIYTEFEYGTPTMKSKVRDLIKNAPSPEERVWVALENGNWVVKATGAEAPEGWDGYMPKEEAESEEL